MIDVKNIIIRKNTSDQHIFNSVFKKNEYNINKLSPNTIVVDIGSHIGCFSLKAYEMGARHIYAFEANIENFIVCEYNTKPYNIKNFNNAVRGNYTVKAFDSYFNKNNNSPTLNYGGLPLRKGDSIKTITLEDIITLVGGHIDILKLDCEGSEYSILYESNRDIFNNIECILGEYHAGILPVNVCEGFENSPQKLEQYIQNLGYNTDFTPSINPNLGHFVCKKIS